MRRVVPFLLMFAVSACGTPLRWDKAGATDQLVQADFSACRGAAQIEANRYYYPWGWGNAGGAGATAAAVACGGRCAPTMIASSSRAG